MVQTRKQRSLVDAATRRHELIPGLPYDVALLCLARVPPLMQASLAGVCRSWRKAVVEERISQSRSEQGLKEEWLLAFVRTGLQGDDGVAVLAFNPLTQAWAKGKKWVPTAAHCLYNRRATSSPFGTSTGNKVVFLGGPIVQKLEHCMGHETTSEVWSFEPVLQRWSQEPSIPGRYWAPACGFSEGKILAVGNAPWDGRGARSTKCLDMTTKKWSSFLTQSDQPFLNPHGTVLDGRFWALGQAAETFQHVFQAWDFATERWTSYPAPDCLPPPCSGGIQGVTSVSNTLYVSFSDERHGLLLPTRIWSCNTQRLACGEVHTLHESATTVPHFRNSGAPLLASSSTNGHLFVVNVYYKVKKKPSVSFKQTIAIQDVGFSETSYSSLPRGTCFLYLRRTFPLPGSLLATAFYFSKAGKQENMFRSRPKYGLLPEREHCQQHLSFPFRVQLPNIHRPRGQYLFRTSNIKNYSVD